MYKKFWVTLSIIVWISALINLGFIYYVNLYLPHGPSYPTGEYHCANDDRGPCGEIYEEDLSGLNIPGWAIFFKKSYGELLFIGLITAGTILYIYKVKKPSE